MELIDGYQGPFETNFADIACNVPAPYAVDSGYAHYSKWDGQYDCSQLYAQPQLPYYDYSQSDADPWLGGTPYTALTQSFSPQFGCPHEHKFIPTVHTGIEHPTFPVCVASQSSPPQLSPIGTEFMPSGPTRPDFLSGPMSAFTRVNSLEDASSFGSEIPPFSVDNLLSPLHPRPTNNVKATSSSKAERIPKAPKATHPTQLRGSPRPLIYNVDASFRKLRKKEKWSSLSSPTLSESSTEETLPSSFVDLARPRPRKKRRLGPPPPFNSGRGTFLINTKDFFEHGERRVIWRIDGRSHVERCLLLKYTLGNGHTMEGHVYERTQKYIYAESETATHFEVLGKISHVYKENCAPVDRILVQHQLIEHLQQRRAALAWC
ncbi:hypothetical protein AAVH_02339 [Aphelenchoides avenae]|nr:hypothetical protein AAVH_02339 [Aphelenchus avenae]